MNKNLKQLTHELKHHLPFTLIATTIAIIIVISLKYIFVTNFDHEAFEILHPIHVLASAIVSTAIFYKYKKNVPYSILVGILSAILIGTISDVIFPFLGGSLFQLPMELHIPIFAKPLLILGVALIGTIIGMATKITKMPHLIHVGISVFASLFYILSFTNGFSILFLIATIIIVAIAVVIPCCISDIIMPFWFLKKKIQSCNCKH